MFANQRGVGSTGEKAGSEQSEREGRQPPRRISERSEESEDSPRVSGARAPDVTEESGGYRIVKAGPSIDAEEVENANVPAIEVMILWESTVLHVSHLTPPRSFFVGDDVKDGEGFRLPSEKIGASKLPLLVVRGASVCAAIPRGAKGSIEIPGEGRVTLDDARSRGLLRAGEDGHEEISLSHDMRARVEINGFVLQTAAVSAGKKLASGRFRPSRAGIAFAAGSFALHFGLVLGLMLSPGDSLDDDSSGLDKSTSAYLMQLSKNSADHEIAAQESTNDESTKNDDKSGGTGQKHAGAEGMMGDPSKSVTNGYYQVKGPKENPKEQIARLRSLIENNNYGAIGALSSVFGSNANAPIMFDSAFDQTIGRDPNNFNGNLTGTHPDDGFGYGGLGLSGTGPGGGAPWGDGIGLGKVGGFGHGSGTCTDGPCLGWGGGGSRTGIPRKTGTVKPLEVGSEIIGRLPPETVKRIIRANFPRFRACYEQGLKKDPALRGTVGVRFIIDNTGAVETASLTSSVSDGQVSACVLGVYRTLSFPEPEGGKVMVTYPIAFDNE